jgi:hypothetical protein
LLSDFALWAHAVTPDWSDGDGPNDDVNQHLDQSDQEQHLKYHHRGRSKNPIEQYQLVPYSIKSLFMARSLSLSPTPLFNVDPLLTLGQESAPFVLLVLKANIFAHLLLAVETPHKSNTKDIHVIYLQVPSNWNENKT